ncbi:MAG: substrate-binding domain-containing protein, partial [Lachnospiraceae bacterium]|nr:substrate-binding domain-containing protein [Lachnospiraceae bacterium]
ICVAGYDNSSLCMIASPQITSIQSPFGEFGTEASGLLISLLESGGSSPDSAHKKADPREAVRITIDPAVCFRKSTER